MGWLEKLRQRWKLSSYWQVIVVLIVFAFTGMTVFFLKRPVLKLFVSDGGGNVWFSVTYYLLILPVYNIILLIYGFIFGQFDFFWSFEKRLFRRIVSKIKGHKQRQ